MASTETVNIIVNAQDNASATLKDVATGMTVLGGAAGLVLKNALDTFIEFDSAANKMKAFLAPADRTAEVMDGIRQEAIRVGGILPLTNEAVLSGAVALEKMGFSGKETQEALQGISLAAVANDMTDVGLTAEIGGDALRAFGLKGSDMEKVLDIMTKGANSSSMSFEDMSEAMKYAGLGAANAGQDLETTTTMLGLMANQGDKGSMAGTGLREALTKMSDEANVAADGVSYLKDKVDGNNIALTDSKGNFRNTIDVVKDLQKATAGLTEVEKFNTLQNLFGIRGAQAMMAIMNNSTEQIDTMSQAIADSSGTLQEFASILQEGVSGGFMLLDSQMDSFWTTLGGALGTALLPFINGLTQVVSWVTQNQEVITILAGLLSGVFAAGLIGATILLWGLIAPAIPFIAAAGLIGVAVFELSAHFQALSDFFAPLTDVIMTFVDVVYTKFSEWVGAIQKIITPLIQFFQDHWDSVSLIFQGAWTIISAAWTLFWETFTATFSLAWSVFSGIVDVVLAILQGNWSVAWEKIKGVFFAIWETMKTILTGALDFIKSAIDGAWKIITGAFDLGKEAILKLWESLWSGLKSIVDSVGGFILGIVESIAKTIGGVIQAIQNLINKAKELASSAGNAIGGAASAVGGFLGGGVKEAGRALGFKANGGSVSANSPYIVGEQGPELFVPSGNGTIIPNGAGGVNISINVQGNFVGNEEEAMRMGNIIIKQLQFASAI